MRFDHARDSRDAATRRAGRAREQQTERGGGRGPEHRERFRERRDLIVGLLNQVPGVSCAIPGGAFYAWPNVTQACRLTGCADSEILRKRLLHEAGIAVLADIHFGRRVPGEGQHIRFSYATSNDAIKRGVERLDTFVRKNTR